MSFEVELGGSGAAGTAAPWMELLEGCGMAPPVLAAGVSATQRMGTPAAEASSLSLASYQSDQLRRGLGARGSFSLDVTAGAYPFAALQLTAMLPPNAFETALPGLADLTRWQQPLEVNRDNTVVTLDGYAMRLRSFRAEAGVQSGLRSLVGARYINRGQHAMSATVVIEAPSYAERNFLSSLRTGALLPLSVVHGTQPGHILEMAAAQAQVQDVTEGEEDGKVMWTVPLTLAIAQGGDDLVLVAK